MKGPRRLYDANGVLLQRLASGGSLNDPWGLAMAPGGIADESQASWAP